LNSAAWLTSILMICLSGTPIELMSQTASGTSDDQDANLKFVVYLSRHGVRSPTGKPAQYNAYSSASWPSWNVPPGNLTAHGFRLMQLFGAYDRIQLASQGLLSVQGCEDANRVLIYSDSDQRTRETGRALELGLFPECSAPIVQGLPEHTPDPLFHPLATGTTALNSKLAVAAIAGRIGGDPNNLTTIYRTRLSELDTILAKCGTQADSTEKRMSILEVPAVLTAGKGDHAVELRGPLNTASTLTENLLLEYIQDMDNASVGWGCVDGSHLRSLLELHAAASDFTQRTPLIAQLEASNLMDHIRRAIQQAAGGQAIPGAISRPTDRALFLVGHDTNLSNVAGLLNLTWIADGRRDDTPPGASLVFELWHSRQKNTDFVRVFYTSQTLEQMRSETTLTPTNPPVRVPVFVPGCSSEDFSCSLASFAQIIMHAIAPASILPN
jgi:4-phytase / acid phosphatase